MKSKAICVAVALALAGCGTTSPMLKPNVSAPAAWNEPALANAATVAPDWWQSFGSSELGFILTGGKTRG